MIKSDSNFSQNGSHSSRDNFASSKAPLKNPTSNSGKAKPLASISLDLDNLWSYMKTHGDTGWESFPSYMDVFIPCVLDALEKWNLKITFFIVGQDAALYKNRDALSLLTQRGHEVGNHSFNHEPWIKLYSREKIRADILDAEEHIQKATGQKPVGYRGPGFSWSPDLFEVLIENDYLYDASTLPTYLGPMARLYYFWKSDLSQKEKSHRKELFGNFKDGLRPIKPYQWELPSGNRILEIPVSTIPLIKSPFHLSYLLYLSRLSGILMLFYLNIAIYLCKITGTHPSFLLHPLDLQGCEQIAELKFFPGMDLGSESKVKVFHKVINALSKHFTLSNMSTNAEWLSKKGNLKTIKLNLQKPSPNK